MRRAGRHLVELGVIAGAHGVRGEVKIACFTDAPEDIAAYGPLSDETGAGSFKIVSLRPARGGVVARLEGISDRNAAEAMKGTRLHVAREALPEPEAESWYRDDLIGLAVEDREGGALGRVRSVQNYGAGDLIEIELADRRQTELLPFTSAFVPEVDIAGGRIIVALPDNFLEPARPPERRRKRADG